MNKLSKMSIEEIRNLISTASQELQVRQSEVRKSFNDAVGVLVAKYKEECKQLNEPHLFSVQLFNLKLTFVFKSLDLHTSSLEFDSAKPVPGLIKADKMIGDYICGLIKLDVEEQGPDYFRTYSCVQQHIVKKQKDLDAFWKKVSKECEKKKIDFRVVFDELVNELV